MFTVLGIEFSILAILVAGVVGMVIGALWYGPIFGKQWMQMVGKSEADLQGDNNILYLVVVLTNIGYAKLITIIFSLTGFAAANDYLSGVGIVALIWLLMFFPGSLNHALFEGRDWKLVVLNAGMDFAVLLIQAMIIIGLS